MWHNKLASWFANQYIMHNMGHEYREQREEIYATLSYAFCTEFNEDNIHNRIHQTVQWILENDEEFYRIYNGIKYRKGEKEANYFAEMVGRNANDGIQDAVKKSF